MTTAVGSTANSLQGLIDSLNGATKGAGKADQQTTFLTLLTTQLKNQDPLNPMDNQQMTSQLAQISTVDGIERLNATLQSLMGNATESQVMQAAALVGKAVLVPGAHLVLQDGAAIGGIELDGPADAVKVTIKDASGLTVRTLDLGALESGSTAFAWDGKSDSGADAADGSYQIAIEAKRGSDKVTANKLELGIVSGVVRTPTGAQLSIGSLGNYALGDVKQIL